MTDLKKSPAQLLRKPYQCSATHQRREYFLYLPCGYETESQKRWPVILFLHGGGTRGDGLEDLDWVLEFGPLGEAWIQRRDLPFIMIGPQLPVFGLHAQVQLREGLPRPQRLPDSAPPRRDEERPDFPMMRAPDDTPALPELVALTGKELTEATGIEGLPGGWQNCEKDLLGMVDDTLRTYRADPSRVYLTGLSYGGRTP